MKKMQIILEGQDNTGKTTLAKYFSDIFKIPYYHLSGPEDTAFSSFKTRKFEMVEKTRQWCVDTEKYDLVVCDRSPIGELVYANYRINKYEPDISKYINMDNITLVIICLSNSLCKMPANKLDQYGLSSIINNYNLSNEFIDACNQIKTLKSNVSVYSVDAFKDGIYDNLVELIQLWITDNGGI